MTRGDLFALFAALGWVWGYALVVYVVKDKLPVQRGVASRPEGEGGTAPGDPSGFPLSLEWPQEPRRPR